MTNSCPDHRVGRWLLLAATSHSIGKLANPLSTILTPLAMLPPSSLGWQPPPPAVPTPILHKSHVHSRFLANLPCLTSQFSAYKSPKPPLLLLLPPNLLLITFLNEVLIPRPCVGHEANAWYRRVRNSSPLSAGVCQLHLLLARVDQVRYGGPCYNVMRQ